MCASAMSTHKRSPCPNSRRPNPKRAAVSRKPTKTKSTRKRRSRPTPKWLRDDNLSEIAKRRTLMLLDVLSGRTPVTDAIREAKISRGTYYQLETKGLKALLAAMQPTTPGTTSEVSAKTLDRLNCKIDSLERDKRRLERLLLLATKVLKSGPVTRRKAPRRARSVSSKNSTTNSSNGTPTRAGENE